MKKVLLQISKIGFELIIFGLIYFAIECVYKGKITDIRMLVLGAILGVIIGVINNAFSYETDFILQCIIGMLLITLAEAVLGYQWNIVEHREIWDYSNLLLNGVDGQVSLIFSLCCWTPLSGIAIILDDWIEWKIFHYKNEIKPYYMVFKKKIYLY